MHKANDITAIAIQYGLTFLPEGINKASISQKIAAKHAELGGQYRFASVTFGVASSFPHGSSQKLMLKEGDTSTNLLFNYPNLKCWFTQDGISLA
jgi:Xaa-Pro aminopeptidase